MVGNTNSSCLSKDSLSAPFPQDLYKVKVAVYKKIALEAEGTTCFNQNSNLQMASLYSMGKEEAEPELLKKHRRESSQRDQGEEFINEDAEIVFVGVISNPKPVISNILNRVIPGSNPKRKRGYPSQGHTHASQSVIHVTPMDKATAIMPDSGSEWRSTDSPVTTEHSSKPSCKINSPPVVLPSSSDLLPPKPPCVAGAALSIGGRYESARDPKQLSILHVNSNNAKQPKLRGQIPSVDSSVGAPSDISAVVDTSTPSKGTCFSSRQVQNGTSSPCTYANEKVGDPDSVNNFEELIKRDFSSLAGQNKTFDPKTGNLVLLLSDFYYGQHKGDEEPTQKTHTTFKCLSCLKVLKNVRFMNHMKHHLELEKQRGDSWENHTTCPHCHRKFPTPFQLQCHIDSVHTTQELSAVCKICELSFKTDQVLLQHMKDNHKPGEMPYVCQLCNYRSSAFADVEIHFKTCHENTNYLLCLFCLKIFRTSNPYMKHCWRHWRNNRVFPCSKCRLQFLTLKEETEHRTKNHQTFKKPEPMEGLPPETEVIIQTSVHPTRSTASTIVSNIDPCLSPRKSKRKKSMIS